MRTFRWLSLAVIIIFIATCFFPWVVIPGKDIVISGVHAEGTNYGKPGYFNLIVSAIIFVFGLFPKIWAIRANIFLAAFNLGWTLRNFLILSACEGGICPERQPAFYVYLLSSVLVMVTVLLQKAPEPKTNNAI